MSALTLRPHQLAAIDALYEYWRGGGGNPLVDMATGTGKSVVIAELIRRLYEGKPTRRFLVLTHVRELIEQDASALRAVWPDAPIGINSAGLGEREWDAPIVLAGIQSVYKTPEQLGPRNLVLVDESHMIPRDGDGMYRTVLARLRVLVPTMRVAGFSATCYRLDCGRLDEGDDRLFDRIAYSYGLAEGIRDGWLAPLVAKATASEIDVAGVARRGGEFIAGELEHAANQANIVEAAVAEIIERGADRRAWLCFCSGVKHAEHVRDVLRARGVVAETVAGETASSERERIFDDFRAGRVRALTGANIFTTGFDVPQVDMIAMLRPTLSTGLYVQMLGRGTRKAEGKSSCLVLDFSGNVRRHGPADAVSVTTRERAAVRPDSENAKVCPACDSLVARAASVCPDCGHEWKRREVKHALRADSLAVLSSELTWITNRSTIAFRHEKPGSRPTLRIEYSGGYREWLALEHEGYAREVAERKWRALGGELPVPQSVAEALSRVGELASVTHIAIQHDGQHWQVINHRITRAPDLAQACTEQVTAPRVGETISHRTPCPHCGSHKAVIEPARGPHAQHLRCADCGRGGRWLRRNEASTLSMRVAHDG
jgi:DNA repair protein RadD